LKQEAILASPCASLRKVRLGLSGKLETERVLADRLAELGGTIHRGAHA
jgi:hypothetical protein